MSSINDKLATLKHQLSALKEESGDDKYIPVFAQIDSILTELVIGKQKEEHELFKEKLQQYIQNRTIEILNGNNPLKLTKGSNMVIQIVPQNAFNVEPYEISKLKEPNSFNLYPFYSSGFNERSMYDGFMTYAEFNGFGEGYGSYVKVYNSGIIEATNNGFIMEREGKKLIPSVTIEQKLIEHIGKYCSYLKELGVDCPLYILVSIQNIKGYQMAVSPYYFDSPSPIDMENFNSKIVVLKDYNEHIDVVIRPILNQLWNASGWSQSPYYNQDGRWEYER